MPHSHHSHSGQFCKHASGTLEDVVKEAIRQGFEIYGLTEHVPRYRVQDLYPEEVLVSCFSRYRQLELRLPVHIRLVLARKARDISRRACRAVRPLS